MSEDITDQIEYYYDSHSPEEDLIEQTAWHSMFVEYLWNVLTQLFHGQDCAVYKNLSFYREIGYKQYPLAPDLAVLKGVAFTYVRNWVVDRSRPAPNAAFEILPEETWEKVVYEKPGMYAYLGVQEYFAYDPHEPPISRVTVKRLFGWRLDTQRKEMVEIIPNAEGWMWSEQLESWLVPDGILLRLYDRERHMRLTRDEAQTLMIEQVAERAAEEARQAQEARHAEEEAKKRADEATRRAEEEARRAQTLAEKLRALGINPDEVV